MAARHTLRVLLSNEAIPGLFSTDNLSRKAQP
jgi:hypothetical protein